MKKLLITLILVGGIISGSCVAQGMDLEISVNGDLDPCDYEVVLQPGETAVLNIHSTDGYAGWSDEVYFWLIVDTNFGTITGGEVTPAAPPDTFVYDDPRVQGMCFPPDDGIWGAISDFGGGTYPPGIYIDAIEFHCAAEGAATINLYSTPDFVNVTLEDTVIIQQTTDCVNSDAPFYTEWEGGPNYFWSKPDCWCFQRQCRGDMDGIKNGPFWVAIQDLNIYRMSYGKTDPFLTQQTICADLDHIRTGPFRVAIPDLNIFRLYFNKFESQVPVCPMDWDGDGDDDYNYWKN